MTDEKGKVQEKDKVKVEYEGSLNDGTVFDSSEKQGQPLEFEAGTGKVIKGVDQAVLGMEEGEEKEVNLKSEEAYGDRREELVQKVPKSQMPEGQEVNTGMVLAVKSPDGQEFPATVTDIDEENVTIDMNPPLAGKDLNFKLKVVGIEKSSEDQADE